LEPSGRHGCGWRWRGNVVIVNAGFPGLTAETEGAGKAVRLGFTGDYHDLLNGKYRYRYEVKP
jgi:hypothetical protein